jgi:hypothetical protein
MLLVVLRVGFVNAPNETGGLRFRGDALSA